MVVVVLPVIDVFVMVVGAVASDWWSFMVLFRASTTSFSESGSSDRMAVPQWLMITLISSAFASAASWRKDCDGADVDVVVVVGGGGAVAPPHAVASVVGSCCCLVAIGFSSLHPARA